jgi:TonB-linked SusC/RagA family outer membrane protein
MLGYESWQLDGRHFNVTGNGYPIAVAQSLNLTTGAIASTDRYNVDQNRLLSQFGRFNYSYNNKYLIEANLRRDGSSKFSSSNLWGVFPSFSVGWKISEEPFFQSVPVISALKIRASQGKLGSNGGIANFSYQSTYTSQFSSYSFDNLGSNKVPGFYLSRFSNPDVHWEESNMTDIAMDMRLFQNKFSISVDYYRKDTKGLLVGVPIPASVGISTNNFDSPSPQVNIGTLRNTGIDIDLGYTTNINKFNIAVNGNTSFMKNKMLSLFNQYITGGDGGGQIGGMTRTYAGKPISSFYGYRVQQMLNTASDIYAINTYSKDGIYQEAATAPGDLMYRDLNGPSGVPDGKVTAEYDRTVIGNPWPTMTYALNAGITYNQMFDISIQFQGVQGVDVFNANKSYSRNFFGDDNSTTLIRDAWTPDNHTSNPRNIANDPNGNFSKPSTYFIENGSYLKLRNLQIGFNVPKALLAKINIKKVRLYANGNNLLTITKYSGTDPEIAGSNVSRGVDYGLYPQVRTYSAGIEVQF